MKVIAERQLVVISASLATQNNIKVPIELRFNADEVILKNITYASTPVGDNSSGVINIFSNLTADPIIGSFPTGWNNFTNAVPVTTFYGSVSSYFEQYLTLANKFRVGIVNFQFQQPAGTTPYVGNSPLIAANTFLGTVTFTLDFIRYK